MAQVVGISVSLPSFALIAKPPKEVSLYWQGEEILVDFNKHVIQL